MLKKRKLNENIEKLNNTLTKNNLIEIAAVIGNKKKLFIRNLIAGISRGIGIGIGFTILTSIIVYILQKVIRLNIPVISSYIADIVNIVNGR